MTADPVGPDSARLRRAFVESVLSDPFRTRSAALEDVAARTATDVAAVQSAIPAPGSPEWIAELSPSSRLPELRWGRTPDELRADLTSEDQDVRSAGLRDLVYATVPSDESRAIVLEVLATNWVWLRTELISSAWRHFIGRKELRERLRELLSSSTNENVRIAAIKRIGLDVDRDPETVTALLESTIPSVVKDVRVAAIGALATTARGYPRAVGAVAFHMKDEEASVRVAAYQATVELVDDATQTDIARWLIDAGEERPDLLVGAFVALDLLRQRRAGFSRVVLPHLSDEDPRRRGAALPLLGILMESDDVIVATAIASARDDAAVEVRELAETVISRLRSRNKPRDQTDVARGQASPLAPDVEAALK